LIEAWEDIDEGVIEEIVRKMVSKNIVLVPTASVYRAAIGKLRIDRRRFSKYITSWYKYMGKGEIKKTRKIYDKLVKALRILWENNVRIVAGTDLLNFALNPGASIWEEIDVYMEAGLSFWDALRTATGYASELHGWSIGVIRDKGLANLIVLEREPTCARDVEIREIIYGREIIKPSRLTRQLSKIPWFGGY